METDTPPPIDPAQLPNQGSNWPKTIGIIALVFGILGILGGLVSPVSSFLVKASMDAMVTQGADREMVDSYLEQLKSLSFLSAGVMGVLGILLTVGGLFLIKRKSNAPMLLQIWAVLKILGGGYITFRNAALTETQMKITTSAQNMDAEVAAMTERFTAGAAYVGMIFGMLWLIALPVFFIIWFNRSKIKSETADW